MNYFDIVTIAIVLSMDAFAVAVCKGLSLPKIKIRHCITVGLYFGIFQGLMPLIGYLLASTVASKIADFSFYIAFALLLIIGGNMIIEAIKGGDECPTSSMSFWSMISLAVATSIDALAIGVSFSFAAMEVNIITAILLIGIITFFISGVGVKLGNLVGQKFQKTASIIGGGVLIIIGLKILLEGLNII